MTSNKKQPAHIRLPERSELVRGKKNAEGEVVKLPDPRTASQDPVLEKEIPPKPELPPA